MYPIYHASLKKTRRIQNTVLENANYPKYIYSNIPCFFKKIKKQRNTVDLNFKKLLKYNITFVNK